MDKILIVTDSHFSVVRYAIHKDILQQPGSAKEAVELTPEFHLYEDCIVNKHSIDILGLMGRSAYNFGKHINIINHKDYSDYKVVLFMGFNDLLPLTKYKNHKVIVERYIDAAIERFGSQVIIITPLKNLVLIKQKPESVELYEEFVEYLKKYCHIKNIECHDIYSIVGPIAKADLGDRHHIRSDKLLPLYRLLGVI